MWSCTNWRRLQAQRATARHVEWLRRLGRDAAVHHTAATTAPSEGVGPPRADVAQLLAVVRSLEAQLAALAAEVVWLRALCGLLYSGMAPRTGVVGNFVAQVRQQQPSVVAATGGAELLPAAGPHGMLAPPPLWPPSVYLLAQLQRASNEAQGRGITSPGAASTQGSTTFSLAATSLAEFGSYVVSFRSCDVISCRGCEVISC